MKREPLTDGQEHTGEDADRARVQAAVHAAPAASPGRGGLSRRSLFMVGAAAGALALARRSVLLRFAARDTHPEATVELRCERDVASARQWELWCHHPTGVTRVSDGHVQGLRQGETLRVALTFPDVDATVGRYDYEVRLYSDNRRFLGTSDSAGFTYSRFFFGA